MRKAVYAGSFDPITNGHLWMIKGGTRLFDRLVVAIGVNPDKKYTFSLDERIEMLKHTTRDISNVKVDSSENKYLVNYAESIGAEYILRGIRSAKDYEYERDMRNVNGDLIPGITTVFLIPPREFSEISSSFVKGLIGPEGWEEIIKRYVPESVYKILLEKYGR